MIRCLARQRGFAALMAALILVAITIVVLAIGLNMSGSSVYDSAAQNNSVEALYLAETGVERALHRFAVAGVACGALGEGPIAHGRGEFAVATGPAADFSGAALPAGPCRVQVQGQIPPTVLPVTPATIRVRRTVDAILQTGGAITPGNTSFSSITASSLTFAHTVPVGATLLMVGVSVDQTNTAVNTVTYAGQALTRIAYAPGTANNRPKSEIWYRISPPAGTANVVIAMGASDQVIAGAMSFLGVDTTTPFDVAPATARSNSRNATVNITPVTDQAWVFDVLAANDGINVNVDPLGCCAQRWSLTAPGGGAGAVRGAASTIGPVSPPGLVTPGWRWNNNEHWALAAVALRPAGQRSVIAWREAP